MKKISVHEWKMMKIVTKLEISISFLSVLKLFKLKFKSSVAFVTLLNNFELNNLHLCSKICQQL